jgi:hypothetical protein
MKNLKTVMLTALVCAITVTSYGSSIGDGTSTKLQGKKSSEIIGTSRNTTTTTTTTTETTTTTTGGLQNDMVS